MRCFRAVAALVALGASSASTSGTVQLAWTTDSSSGSDNGTFGPDGPWQAVSVMVGNFSSRPSADGSNDFRGVPLPMYPVYCGVSAFMQSPNPDPGYSPQASSTWIQSSESKIDEASFDSDFYSDNGFLYREGLGGFDVFALPQKSTSPVTANATIMPATALKNDAFNRGLPPQVGILGLGPFIEVGMWGGGQRGEFSSILEQLKDQGKINSLSFGIHLGSVPLKQPGSLVLGGYEQNRVIGNVGTMGYNLRRQAATGMLIDVSLGVEYGNTPFNQSGEISVFRPVSDSRSSAMYRQAFNANETDNVATVVFTPATPYIELPIGLCETAAEYLPVTWNESLALYLWNKDDPLFKDITSSSSHLAFAFLDSGGKKITIKIPFQLLNLTLESPIVDSPTPYFPCRPKAQDDAGFWSLGRAFMQGAFLGVNFDRNTSWIAQAPGPRMEPSTITALEANSTSLSSGDASLFEKSWRGLWTNLTTSGTDRENMTTTATTATTTTTADTDASHGPGALLHNPPGYVTASIVLGSAAGLIPSLILLIVYLRRREKKRLLRLSSSSAKQRGSSTRAGTASVTEEKDGINIAATLVSEMGESLPPEFEAGPPVYEAESSSNQILETFAPWDVPELPTRPSTPTSQGRTDGE